MLVELNALRLLCLCSNVFDQNCLLALCQPPDPKATKTPVSEDPLPREVRTAGQHLVKICINFWGIEMRPEYRTTSSRRRLEMLLKRDVQGQVCRVGLFSWKKRLWLPGDWWATAAQCWAGSSFSRRIGGWIPGPAGPGRCVLGQGASHQNCSCVYGVWMLVSPDGQVAPPINEWCHVVLTCFEWSGD